MTKIRTSYDKLTKVVSFFVNWAPVPKKWRITLAPW